MEILTIPVTIDADEVKVCKLGFKKGIPFGDPPYMNFREFVGSFSSREERKTVLIIDIEGIRNKFFEEKVADNLRIRGTDTWFMTAINDVDDIMDAFGRDASKVLMPYHITASDAMLEDVFSLSDSCIPCIFIENCRVKGRTKLLDPVSIVSKLTDIGYHEIAVFDTDGKYDNWRDLQNICSTLDIFTPNEAEIEASNVFVLPIIGREI